MTDSEPGEVSKGAGKELPSFPGMELFSEPDARSLAQGIQDFTELQPKAIIQICEREGTGWQEGGSPDILGVNKVECLVKTRGCSALALETIHLLDGELTSEEILDLVEASGLDYRKIPQAVDAALNSKSKS